LGKALGNSVVHRNVLLPNRPRRLYLDFDGVVMDSMSSKLEAYLFALAPFAPNREAIRKVQRRSAGLSRSKTLPLMALECCGVTLNSHQLEECLQRFTAKDEANREHLCLMPGTKTFLQAAAESEQDLWILTGTPQEVIEKTLGFFDLGHFFNGVLGSPPGKAEHMRNQCGQDSLRFDECLFIGDSPHDMASAMEVGMPFIGFAQTTQDKEAMDSGYSRGFISSLADLLPWPLP
jgi:phosphoglycolate phosphatase-like HAD superfamily hydrolase